MRLIILLFCFVISGCSADECLREKLKEAEKYDEMIEAANTTEVKETLQRNKRLRLEEFDC